MKVVKKKSKRKKLYLILGGTALAVGAGVAIVLKVKAGIQPNVSFSFDADGVTIDGINALFDKNYDVQQLAFQNVSFDDIKAFMEQSAEELVQNNIPTSSKWSEVIFIK